MSDRKPLFKDPIEEYGVFDAIANDSISLSALRRIIGDSAELVARHGGWWWLKRNQHIKISTLHKIVNDGDFRKVAAYLSARWSKKSTITSHYYWYMSVGGGYDSTFGGLVMNVAEHDVKTSLEKMNLSSEDVSAHLNVLHKLRKMVMDGEVEHDKTIINVYKSLEDVENEFESYWVDGRSRGQMVGIEFVPWRRWLGMRVENGSRALYGDIDVVAACLYEMTCVDFDEDVIQKTFEGLKTTIKEVKNGQGIDWEAI